MAGRAADLIEIPATLWQRAAMTEALSNRDMGRVFQLVRQYAGASQTQLAIACGMTQGKISDIMRDRQRVTALEVFERIADGLNMPDSARTTLGLAPAMQPPGADTGCRPTGPALSDPHPATGCSSGYGQLAGSRSLYRGSSRWGGGPGAPTDVREPDRRIVVRRRSGQHQP